MASKKYDINKKIRLSIIGLSIIVLVCESYVSISTLNNHKTIEKKVPVYSYNHKAQINYKMNLKLKNGPLEEKDFVDGKTYLSDYVDSIDGSFTYMFNGDGIVDGKGQYDVTAVIEGQLPGDKGNKTIWRKEIPIQAKTDFKINDKNINIKKEAPIDLKSFKEQVDKINKTSNINFQTKLTIVWNVNMEAKTDKGIIREKLSPVMEIPLKSNYSEVGGNLVEEKKGSIDETKRVPVPINKTKKVLGYVIIALSAASLIFLVFFTSAAGMVDPIQKKLNNIFKKHGDRLVALYDDLHITNESILRVVSIEDMVRIADEIHKPILYKKNVGQDEIFKFYVIDEQSVYLLEQEVRTSMSKA